MEERGSAEMERGYGSEQEEENDNQKEATKINCYMNKKGKKPDFAMWRPSTKGVLRKGKEEDG